MTVNGTFIGSEPTARRRAAERTAARLESDAHLACRRSRWATKQLAGFVLAFVTEPFILNHLWLRQMGSLRLDSG
jgi:hypothetical protein